MIQEITDSSQNCFTLASLYVGDLHGDVSESMLFEKFSVIGPVLSIRVCRDKTTRRSLGYAYVNFQQPADAERALDTMNFDNVQGRPIRIMWSQRDPSLRKSGVGNVFIKNLDKIINNKAMHDTFSAFGKILSCKVAEDENGISKGYGFVHFETEESAQKSIMKVNGMLLQDKKVFVGKFIPRKIRGETVPKAKPFSNVYIKNFGEELNDDTLHKMCEMYGSITSHKVMTNEEGKSRGFGFVAYKEPEEAKNAIENLNGKEIREGKILYAGPAQTKAERQKELRRIIATSNPFQGMNLFIKNLDVLIDDVRLRKEFAPFGTITSAKVMLENGRSKGFGFVCFLTAEEADTAMVKMNGHPLSGKPLYVALAQRKDERMAYLATQPRPMSPPLHYGINKVKTTTGRLGLNRERIQEFGTSIPTSHYPWPGHGQSGDSNCMPRYATTNHPTAVWWAPTNMYRYPQQSSVRYAISAGGGLLENRALRSKNNY